MTTVQQINLGNYANDGTGDDLRTAFTKVNANFQLLFNESNVTNGVNLGATSGNVGNVFLDKNPSSLALEFRTLTSTDNSVTFTSNSTSLNLKANTVVQTDLAPQLGGNLNLGAYHVYGGDLQTTVYGLDFPVTNNILSALVSSNNLNIDFGSFDKPLGYQHAPRTGLSVDLNGTGHLSGFNSPLVNDYDFGTLALAGSLQVGGHYLTLGGNLVTANGNITLTAVSSNVNVLVPQSGTLATTGNTLDAFASTTSAQLASVINDETGTGSLVFNTNPTLVGAVNMQAGSYLQFADGSKLTTAAGLGGALNNTLVNGAFTLTLDSSGILNLPVSLRFQDSSVLSSSAGLITKTQLKSIVAASTSFTDFQARVAAL